MHSINPEYGKRLAELKKAWEEHGELLLHHILTDDTWSAVVQELNDSTYEESYAPAHHRYETTAAGSATLEAAEDLAVFLSKSLGNTLHITDLTVRRYGQGSYTLQHGEQPADGMTAILFIADPWDAAMRGEHVLMRDEPLIIRPEDNTLALFEKQEGELLFVKRVSHHAKDLAHIAITITLR